eukprot:9746311-Ditylum_brightwellii.AAC.1
MAPVAVLGNCVWLIVVFVFVMVMVVLVVLVDLVVEVVTAVLASTAMVFFALAKRPYAATRHYILFCLYL